MTDPVGYQAIADHYRRLIANRVIVDGQKLPSVRKLAEEWGVATKTAQRALTTLRMEGWAQPVPGLGYAAAFRPDQVATLRVAVNGSRQRGEQYASDDEVVILSAGMEQTGGGEADVLGIEAGRPAVLRRGRVRRAGRVIRMSYSWFPPELADLVPELLEITSTPPGSVARIEAATGRSTEITADHFSVDTTTLTLAKEFGVPQGEPVLVRTTIRHDGEGVIEYGRTYFPRHVDLRLEYSNRG